MSANKLPLTPVGRNRRLSALSSTKVRSAFKSPCCSPNLEDLPSGGEAVRSPTTPKPLARKRRSALASSFESPLKCKIVKSELSSSDICKLEEHIKLQEEEILQLKSEGLNEDDLQIYIEKLHEYNEIKDTAQIVIGRLAIQLQTTARELHLKFGLTAED